MDNKFIIILLTALLVAMAPNAALAKYANGLAHPNSSNIVECQKCHNAASPILGQNSYNNVCVSCHSLGNSGSNKPFDIHDAANPYGTITSVRTGPLYQSSHNWAGSNINPAAGAQAPSAAMTNANIRGALLCVSCHNVHGAYSSATQSKPFLRIRNDNDAMCVDCHKVRNVSSHMDGSHPINVSYSAARAKKPSDFSPVDSVNNNTKMKLNNGNLLCTTCHGLHYTDSKRGSVIDSSSFNKLSTSKGMLLRTNPRGYNPEDPNICKDCHVGKMAHNGFGQNIQCNDCHSGHVEYDPQASPFDNSTTKNKFLIRRYINISTHYGKISKSRTFYRYTGASREFWVDADRSLDSKAAVGVCQTCHNDTDNFNVGHSVKDENGNKIINPDRKTCAQCHTHGSGSYGCGACHGNPPRQNLKGGGMNKYGYAYYSSGISPTIDYSKHTPPFLDESLTPHSTHYDTVGRRYLISCNQCHHGNEKTHQNGDLQQVFKNHTGIIAGPIASYDKNLQKCSNVYCHSNAQVPPTYKPVDWKNAKDTISKGANRCQSCHGDKNSIVTSPSTLSGVHQKHASNLLGNYACQVCHARTLAPYVGFNNNTGLISPALNHANGIKDVYLNNYPISNAVISNFNYSAGGCGNIYCHSNGKGVPSIIVPNWNDSNTGKCGTCHGVLGPAVSGTGSNARYGMITSNGHFRHLSSTGYGPKMSSYGSSGAAPNGCLKCHTLFSDETKHVNGSVAVDYGSSNPCYKCHGGWQQGAFTQQGEIASLNWNNKGARVACVQCHPINGNYSASRLPNANTAPKQINYSTTGHGKMIKPFLKQTGKSIDCTECHNQNSSHINTIPSNAGVNKRLLTYSNLSTGFLSFTNYTGQRSRYNVLCNKCHWQGQSAERKVMFTHVTSVSEARNNTPTMACTMCHNVHGTSADRMVKNIKFHPMSTAYFIPYTSPYIISYVSPDSTVEQGRSTKKGQSFKFIETKPPYRGFCQICHTKTMHFKRGHNETASWEDGGGREGGTENLNIHVPSINAISHKKFDEKTNCLDCHGHNPPQPSARQSRQYAFYPLNCDGCHGYPPVPKSWNIVQNNYSSGKFEDYTGGGGSHVFQGHIPKSADPSNAWNSCNSCHNDGDHDTHGEFAKVKVSGINDNHKFNGSMQAKYTSNRLDGINHQTGTCYNVSCHFQKTPKWGKP